MENIFKNLPKDLVNLILTYTGKIKYRNGIYTNQLNIATFESNIKIPQYTINKYRIYQTDYYRFYLCVKLESIPYTLEKIIQQQQPDNHSINYYWYTNLSYLIQDYIHENVYEEKYTQP